MRVACDCVIDGTSSDVDVAVHACAQNMKKAKHNKVKNLFTYILDKCCIVVRSHVDMK